MNTHAEFLVGCARRDITPPLEREVYLAGFSRNRQAHGVHDPLYAYALALKHGDTCLVLGALDLLGIARVYCQDIETRVRASVPGARVVLASTHTHHGPDTIGMWGPGALRSGVDKDYMASLETNVTEVILDALDNLQPAWLRCAETHVPHLVKNARDPEIVDDALTCLQFCRPQTTDVLATLMIYPCHPEVLWYDNTYITADYPGALRARVTRETDAPCIFFAGALGGMLTPAVKQHSFMEMHRMGETLAQAGLEALAPLKPHPIKTLTHRSREFTVPLTNPLFKFARLVRLLPRPMAEGGIVTTEVNLLTLGPVCLATGPGEVLPKLGLALKDQLRHQGVTLVGFIGLANDELGYILPQEDFVYPLNPFKPGEHYEETMSIGPLVGPRVMEALNTLISKL